MTYLLHGSTTHTGMGWVDLIPRCGPLYIGGLYALYQTDLIRSANITHVLSVIDYDPDLRGRFPDLALKGMHIDAQDHPNENLLKDFERVVRWIDGALTGMKDGEGEDKGGVFVHCAMGKSRSATMAVAYLMWKFKVGAKEALEQVCEGRPVCEPNPGFLEQLDVWGRMCKAGSEGERKKVYEEWERTRFVGEVWEWDVRRAKARL